MKDALAKIEKIKLQKMQKSDENVIWSKNNFYLKKNIFDQIS